jgi:hypothetical protein
VDEYVPLKAMMEAGGWSDVETVMTSYQYTDDSTFCSLIQEPVKTCRPEGTPQRDRVELLNSLMLAAIKVPNGYKLAAPHLNARLSSATEDPGIRMCS